MTVDDVIAFMRTQMLGVVATNGPDGQPQAALVGIAVSDGCEIVFDAAGASRKLRNLRLDPHIALVIGGTADDERTVQFEGVADEPAGAERERIREVYFARYPGGRDRLAWEGITHVRVRPHWLRYSDFNQSPPLIVEAASDPSGALVVR
jgi:PPOX class probable F420-dependent enzyme